jgi:hypothetical protein
MFSKEHKFKDMLYQKICRKEEELREQAKVPVEPKKAFDKLDVLKVLDEVHLAYTAKKISNMFRATLLERVTKQLNTHDHIVTPILELLCEKGGGYLKRVNHPKGLILQLEKGLYKAAREELLACDL